MQIIGKDFSPIAFAAYVAGLDLGNKAAWAKFVVLHNTGAPTLAQRPNGLTYQHILNLESYYSNTMHWSAGPHCFVDDNGIWVFSPLTAPGVHSFNWNPCSFGVEQLGDYDTEAYDSGRGLLVQQNAIACVAVLSHACGIDSGSMRLHKENKTTTHKDCPGTACADHKARFISDVHDYIVTHLN